MINGVVHERLPAGNYHEDERRTLTSVFNGDVPGFPVAEQLKVALLKENRTLGGHFHYYPELFAVYSGRAVFRLTHPETGAIEEFELIPGMRLMIPPGIFHTADIEAGTVLLGLTQQRYISPEINDHHP